MLGWIAKSNDFEPQPFAEKMKNKTTDTSSGDRKQRVLPWSLHSSYPWAPSQSKVDTQENSNLASHLSSHI